MSTQPVAARRKKPPEEDERQKYEMLYRDMVRKINAGLGFVAEHGAKGSRVSVEEIASALESAGKLRKQKPVRTPQALVPVPNTIAGVKVDKKAVEQVAHMVVSLDEKAKSRKYSELSWA